MSRTTQKKHKKANQCHGWAKSEKIEADYFWVKLKNVGPTFIKFITICSKVSFIMLENHHSSLCGHDFANLKFTADNC